MAIRLPEPISWIDEIVSYYVSDKPGQRKWFTRKMNLLPHDQQQEIWTVLRRKSHLRPEDMQRPENTQPQEAAPEETRRTRNLVSWSDEEWDRLAVAVWRARKNDPSETLIGLVKKVMMQFPENRRRTIRVLNEIKPLVERLQACDAKIETVSDDLEFSKLRIAELESQKQKIPSRDEILGTLTDEEILQHFGQRVLHLHSPDEILKQYSTDVLLSNIQTPDIVAYAFKAGVEMFLDSQREVAGAVRELTAIVKQASSTSNKTTTHGSKPPMPIPRPTPSKLPKVTIVGLLGNQQIKVEERLAGRANFNFVDKNRRVDAIPIGQDVVLLAANFISHALHSAAKKAVDGTNTKLIIHHGGVDMLVRKLDSILPQPVLA